MSTLPDWARPYASCASYKPAPPPACMTITIQGIEIRSNWGGPYGLEAWSGWTEAPDQVGGPVAFESADGGLEGDVYARGRTIRLEGEIIASSHAELGRLMADLGTVLASPRWDWMVVDEETLGLSRQVRVCRLSAPQITQTSLLSAIWTLELQTAAATRVGVTEESVTLSPGQGADVSNGGTAPADVSGVLTGPLTDLMISTPSVSWKYASTIPAGQTRFVDFARRIVRDPATGKHSRIQAVGGWPTIPAGRSRLTASGSGAGRVDLKWRSTWP